MDSQRWSYSPLEGYNERRTSSEKRREAPKSANPVALLDEPRYSAVGTATSGNRIPPSALPRWSRCRRGGEPSTTSIRGCDGALGPPETQRCTADRGIKNRLDAERIATPLALPVR